MMGTVGIAFAVLFGISEALAGIPSVKANSIFQLIHGILGKLAGPSGGPPSP